MSKRHHFTLSLGHELWDELLRASLPIKLTNGEFHLRETARTAVHQLGVRQRVKGLLQDSRTPQRLVRARERASEVWHRRRGDVYEQVDRVFRVSGEWKVELDDKGSRFRYGEGRVGADAWLKASFDGTVTLLREDLTLPIHLERRVGASLTLGQVAYDPHQEAVMGRLQDVALHVGDAYVLQLAGRLAERLLEEQLKNFNPITILRREQVESLVSPLGAPLNLAMGVEKLQFEVSEDELTLRVRLGFTHKQLEERDERDRW